MASLMRRTLVRKELAPAEAGGADLQQLEADRATRGAGELGVGEADAAQGTQQHIGHRGEPQPELVGAHRLGREPAPGLNRGAVGIKVERALLDAVFHLAAGAVEPLVEVAGLVLLAGQRGDDKARVGLARGPFRPLLPQGQALATTRRWRLQLSRVVQVKSLKRRAALPVCRLCSAASASSAWISPTKRLLRASPNRKSTGLVSHQAIRASRAIPESPRSRARI